MATLGSLAVGSTVELNVNGEPRNFIIIHQGLPSALYDSSCDGTWLLMEDIYEKRAWGSSEFDNDYQNSNAHIYLNDTFFGLFDDNIQSAIRQVKIPYHYGTGSEGPVLSGTNGLSAKIFLLSGYEVGWTTSDVTYLPVDGVCLDYFSDCAEMDSKRIAYYNSTPTDWCLRSPYARLSDRIMYVGSNGTHYANYYSASYGIRPAMILDSSASADGGSSLGGFVKIGIEYRELSSGYVKIGSEYRELTESFKRIGGEYK